MGQTSSQIEQQIRAERSQLSENIGELQSKVKNALSWQEQVEQRPLVMFGVAVSAGALLAMLSMKADTSQQRAASGAIGLPSDGSGTLTATAEKKQEALKAWDKAKAAFIGLAMSRTEELLNDSVPGFRERYNNAGQQNTGHEPNSSDARQENQPA
jgi:hypothetical protein